MSQAYRCDKCGQFRGGKGVEIEYDIEAPSTGSHEWNTIQLCPDCAPPVVEMLEAIAASEPEGD